MAQRLVRAKRRLREAGVQFDPPDAGEYDERLPAVLAVVYLVFNEGYRLLHSTRAELLRALGRDEEARAALRRALALATNPAERELLSRLLATP